MKNSAVMRRKPSEDVLNPALHNVLQDSVKPKDCPFQMLHQMYIFGENVRPCNCDRYFAGLVITVI